MSVYFDSCSEIAYDRSNIIIAMTRAAERASEHQPVVWHGLSRVKQRPLTSLHLSCRDMTAIELFRAIINTPRYYLQHSSGYVISALLIPLVYVLL